MSGNLFAALGGWPPMSTLFAEKSWFQGLRDRFRFENAQLDSGDLGVAVIVVGAGAATAWLMAGYLRRTERPKSIDNPRKLFQDLCRVHGLDRHEASLLRTVADGFPLDNPSLLFIDPGLLDAAILDSRWSEESPELSRYRELIFAEDDAAARAAESTPA